MWIYSFPILNPLVSFGWKGWPRSELEPTTNVCCSSLLWMCTLNPCSIKKHTNVLHSQLQHSECMNMHSFNSMRMHINVSIKNKMKNKVQRQLEPNSIWPHTYRPSIIQFLTHPCRRQPLCIKMVYNICWRSFLRGHDPVTITFWGFWLVIHLRWPEWRTRPESKGSCWNWNAVNYCTKNSDVTCPFHVFIVRTLFYFSDLCFLQ